MIILGEGDSMGKGMQFYNILFCIFGIYYNEHYYVHNSKSNKVWKIESLLQSNMNTFSSFSEAEQFFLLRLVVIDSLEVI